MALDPPAKLGCTGITDVPFAAGVGYRLLQEIGAAAGLKQVRDGSFDCRNGESFLHRDGVWREIVVVYGNALGHSPSQAGRSGNSQVDRCGICIGDSVNHQGRLV